MLNYSILFKINVCILHTNINSVNCISYTMNSFYEFNYAYTENMRPQRRLFLYRILLENCSICLEIKNGFYKKGSFENFH